MDTPFPDARGFSSLMLGLLELLLMDVDDSVLILESRDGRCLFSLLGLATEPPLPRPFGTWSTLAIVLMWQSLISKSRFLDAGLSSRITATRRM